MATRVVELAAMGCKMDGMAIVIGGMTIGMMAVEVVVVVAAGDEMIVTGANQVA